MARVCKDCDFVSIYGDQHECHRYPPPWTNKMVDADDWCGEFSASSTAVFTVDAARNNDEKKVDIERSKKIAESYESAFSMFEMSGDMFCSMAGLGGNHEQYSTGKVKFREEWEFADTLRYLDDLYLAAVMMGDASIPLTIERLSTPLPTGSSFFADVRSGTPPCSAAEKVIAAAKSFTASVARKLSAPSKKKATTTAKGKYGKR